MVEFVWRLSIARPRKPPVIRKNLADISYTSRVIADFVPNFVAMATGVGRSGICLASLNSPAPKTPGYTQKSPGYLLHKPNQKLRLYLAYSQSYDSLNFCQNFPIGALPYLRP